ncbi:MAG: alginate export family protein [Myxococcota bacterium]
MVCLVGAVAYPEIGLAVGGPASLAYAAREAGDGSADKPLAPQRKRLTERADEERPDESLVLPLWGRPLTLSGEYEIKTSFDGDLRLDDAKEDDRARMRHKLELELFYPLTEAVSAFVEGKAFHERDLYREDGERREASFLERGETWIHAAGLGGSGLSLQLGRQNFKDVREWWWDTDLDSVRLHYDHERWHAELAVAEELGRVSTEEDFLDPEQEDVLRVLAHARVQVARRHRIELFALHQNDRSGTEGIGRIVDQDRRDEVDGDLTWLGLRALGRWGLGSHGKLHYWWNGALVRGEEAAIDYDDAGGGRSFVDGVSERRVSGWALDAGLTWATRWAGRPSLSLGYAVGSAGEADASVDRSFRQTGLHDNDGRFRGVDRFRYYGELLEPELSNLHIGTLSVGMPVLESSSVELAYHYYHQVRAADFLRDSRLRADPDGRRRSIGHELDLIVGIEEWERVRLELVGAAFRAGAAFDDERGELAFRTVAKVEFLF